jgi:hypothetical protein
MILPLNYDVTPNGKMVGVSSLGIDGYTDNENFQMRMYFNGSNMVIDYYGDDGSISDEKHLSEILSKSKLKNPDFVSVEGSRIELPIYIDDANGGMALLVEAIGQDVDICYVANHGVLIDVDDALVICTVN